MLEVTCAVSIGDSGDSGMKRAAIAVALGTLAASGAMAQRGDLEARIAELERQLEVLKQEVRASEQDQASRIESIAVTAETARDAARPGRDSSGTVFDYGGYVQLDTILSHYGEGRPDKLMDDLFVPSLIPVESAAGDSDGFNSLNMHAKTSRFFFKTRTETDAGTISSHIELDFLLSGQGDERVSNSFSSRVRHAIVSWDYAENKSLMAGQYWSTFFNVAALPDYLDFVGPAGTVFERQPQIRWTGGPLQLAIENQTSRINVPEGGSRINDGEVMPDLVARYNGRSDNLSWSVAGILRQLSYEVRATPQSEISSDEAWAYALSVSGKWQGERDDLRFMANVGPGLGRYIGLNAFNDGYVDSDGNIDTIHQWGAVLAYRHYWSPQWRSTLGLSASGADNPSQNDFLAAGELAKRYRSMHVNLNYLPAPRLQIGGELMYGYKELEDGRDGDMSRLQFAVKYAF